MANKISQTHPSYDLIIVGGNYTGTLLALLAARLGLSIAVIEPQQHQATTPSEDGKAFAINQRSLDILDQVDLAAPLIKQGQGIVEMEVGEAHLLRGVSNKILHFSGDDDSNLPLGIVVASKFVQTSLQNSLQQQLSARVDAAGSKILAAEKLITLINSRVVNVNCGNNTRLASVTLADPVTLPGSKHGQGREPGRKQGREPGGSKSQQLSAQLVVACDGRFSQLRKFAGIATNEINYRTSALVFNVKLSQPHHGHAIEYFYPSGPFALVPLPHQHGNIIWCEQRELATWLQQQDLQTLEQHLNWRSANRFGKLSIISKQYFYPLSLLHARQYVQQRLVLVGDAAHAIHPIAGLALNLGFRDVASLINHLRVDLEAGKSIGQPASLLRYQRARRFDCEKLVFLTDNINRLFVWDFAPVRTLRQLGFGLVQHNKFLQDFFISQASAGN